MNRLYLSTQFNFSINISYNIYRDADIFLILYSISGREIERLIDSQKSPGNYTHTYNAGNIPAGVYFVRLEVNGETDMKKVVLVR